MCEQCWTTTVRNYRAGFLFFASLAGLFILIAPFIVATEYRRFGGRSALEALAILLVVAGLAGTMGLGIRYFGSRGNR
jgi:hypothetical protein